MPPTQRRPKRTVPTVAPIESLLPVRYRLKIIDLANNIVESFSSATPVSSFRVGELIDPTHSNVSMPEGSWWKITNIVHRVSAIENSHITHHIGICVEVVPRPK
jgi:hypothetical protein